MLEWLRNSGPRKTELPPFVSCCHVYVHKSGRALCIPSNRTVEGLCVHGEPVIEVCADEPPEALGHACLSALAHSRENVDYEESRRIYELQQKLYFKESGEAELVRNWTMCACYRNDGRTISIQRSERRTRPSHFAFAGSPESVGADPHTLGQWLDQRLRSKTDHQADSTRPLPQE